MGFHPLDPKAPFMWVGAALALITGAVLAASAASAVANWLFSGLT